MTRVYNFSAGPACLPEWVLKKAAEEMLDAHESGMSVMEMSHRSSEFQSILDTCKERLCRLMNIPEDYEILFCQGGGTMQFSMVPLNLLKHSADIINTGQWTKKAIMEHEKLGTTHVIASSADANFTYIPKITQNDLSPDSDYLYICENNTIYGTKYKELPPHEGKLLVADLSSCILSEKTDVSKYDLIFAGAQKNMGPAGVTIVIIKKDLIGHAKENIPSLLDYKTYADNDSMYNTPPCYSIYMVGLVLEWLEKEIGGLDEMEKLSRKRAKMLYDYIDSSKLYSNPVVKEDRSYTNIPFVTGNADLDKKFVKEAKEAGLVNLKGHRTVGGMRASLYNAMPIEGVEALIEFMKKFEKENLNACTK
ncbi:phosphoserine aminotransferase [Faecalicoccus acidiformans]|uniref:Phosphoserine aminotransferase n=1 Tax=Faecalicoccus acidiformans TaxID=915173 RepID=A0A7W8D1N5_9FIRM|nr:3-phosphoserine/phosphohydroxythreonine transaminase [Faecalicoccus acidiformans]MBB5185610.1 phosphoserine aminotransferase [Faecalicoccus acidiformans]